ncbi:unnamed protein product [Prorocentrum cordatum]|uniref:Uncharacterized protein n=1 Tax=Prorocentrum cordatum TaxID=2364126 RepID=A0ABN9PSQ3_9DINO|nr:unnamed protein product [Polarella glacialis]
MSNASQRARSEPRAKGGGKAKGKGVGKAGKTNATSAAKQRRAQAQVRDAEQWLQACREEELRAGEALLACNLEVEDAYKAAAPKGIQVQAQAEQQQPGVEPKPIVGLNVTALLAEDFQVEAGDAFKLDDPDLDITDAEREEFSRSLQSFVDQVKQHVRTTFGDAKAQLEQRRSEIDAEHQLLLARRRQQAKAIRRQPRQLPPPPARTQPLGGHLGTALLLLLVLALLSHPACAAQMAQPSWSSSGESWPKPHPSQRTSLREPPTRCPGGEPGARPSAPRLARVGRREQGILATRRRRRARRWCLAPRLGASPQDSRHWNSVSYIFHQRGSLEHTDMLDDLAAAPGSGVRTAERGSFAQELCDDAWSHPWSIVYRRLLRQSVDDWQAAEEAAYEKEANHSMVWDVNLQCWSLLTGQAPQFAKGPLSPDDGPHRQSVTLEAQEPDPGHDPAGGGCLDVGRQSEANLTAISEDSGGRPFTFHSLNASLSWGNGVAYLQGAAHQQRSEGRFLFKAFQEHGKRHLWAEESARVRQLGWRALPVPATHGPSGRDSVGVLHVVPACVSVTLAPEQRHWDISPPGGAGRLSVATIEAKHSGEFLLYCASRVTGQRFSPVGNVASLVGFIVWAVKLQLPLIGVAVWENLPEHLERSTWPSRALLDEELVLGTGTRAATMLADLAKRYEMFPPPRGGGLQGADVHLDLLQVGPKSVEVALLYAARSRAPAQWAAAKPDRVALLPAPKLPPARQRIKRRKQDGWLQHNADAVNQAVLGGSPSQEPPFKSGQADTPYCQLGVDYNEFGTMQLYHWQCGRSPTSASVRDQLTAYNAVPTFRDVCPLLQQQSASIRNLRDRLRHYVLLEGIEELQNLFEVFTSRERQHEDVQELSAWHMWCSHHASYMERQIGVERRQSLKQRLEDDLPGSQGLIHSRHSHFADVRAKGRADLSVPPEGVVSQLKQELKATKRMLEYCGPLRALPGEAKLAVPRPRLQQQSAYAPPTARPKAAPNQPRVLEACRGYHKCVNGGKVARTQLAAVQLQEGRGRLQGLQAKVKSAVKRGSVAVPLLVAAGATGRAVRQRPDHEAQDEELRLTDQTPPQGPPAQVHWEPVAAARAALSRMKALPDGPGCMGVPPPELIPEHHVRSITDDAVVWASFWIDRFDLDVHLNERVYCTWCSEYLEVFVGTAAWTPVREHLLRSNPGRTLRQTVVDLRATP